MHVECKLLIFKCCRWTRF